jgi:hypothetical protein
MLDGDKSHSKKSISHADRKKILLGAVAAAIAAAMVGGINSMQLSVGQVNPQVAPVGATATVANPTSGYDIHVTVNRHDSANLNAPIDHYCKLDKRIVAVCQLYARDSTAMPGSGPQLAQIEFIITKAQYLQLPPRERASWHNHAVELTPERGAPSCVTLPAGLECSKLVSLLQTTYGKVITLWDPADSVPKYPPYVYNVESPYALGQDLNNHLQTQWPTGCGNTSSANLTCGK